MIQNNIDAAHSLVFYGYVIYKAHISNLDQVMSVWVRRRGCFGISHSSTCAWLRVCRPGASTISAWLACCRQRTNFNLLHDTTLPLRVRMDRNPSLRLVAEPASTQAAMSKQPHRPAQSHHCPLASKSPLSWTMAKKFHENGRLMKTCPMLNSAFH